MAWSVRFGPLLPASMLTLLQVGDLAFGHRHFGHRQLRISRISHLLGGSTTVTAIDFPLSFVVLSVLPTEWWTLVFNLGGPRA
jgi:hypothetical protein